MTQLISTPYLLKINTKVSLDIADNEIIGYIAGYGINHSTIGQPYTVYLVELETGSYLEGKRIYVKTLVCSQDLPKEVKE